MLSDGITLIRLFNNKKILRTQDLEKIPVLIQIMATIDPMKTMKYILQFEKT